MARVVRDTYSHVDLCRPGLTQLAAVHWGDSHPCLLQLQLQLPCILLICAHGAKAGKQQSSRLHADSCLC